MLLSSVKGISSELIGRYEHNCEGTLTGRFAT
jgi:hypothetical protein